MKLAVETPADKKLEESFSALQNIEAEIQRADAEVEQFKNNLFTPIYDRRREYLNKIPKFWYIVLAQHEDFQEYISIEDMKYLELISDIYVKFWDETDVTDKKDFTIDSLPKKGFNITVSFKTGESTDNKIKAQTIVKRFEWTIDPTTGSRKLESSPVGIEWPESLKTLNPVEIKRIAKDENRQLTSEEKKRYRQGMRSFFSFWQWSGKKPGKEYRNGEELATLIAEDIFPAALDYYVIAAPGIGEEDEEDEETSGEELDLSDHDDADTDDKHDSKRQRKI